MREDAYPFFIGPHRFDVSDDDGLLLDRRYELVPELGERFLGRYRLSVAGDLLDPCEGRRQWSLPVAATVTVTDRRVVHVCTDSTLTLVGTGTGHQRRVQRPRLVSGQVRWQWPSRLELRSDEETRDGELLIVCDALRTIRQPTLTLAGPAPLLTELARQIRRAVAGFRLTRPELVELSPPERDALARQNGPAPVLAGSRVALPGSLPVEFLSRDDYYRRGTRPMPGRLRQSTRPAPAAQPRRPGSAC
ncbi:hypothetical protein [Micromonospora yangpuensis]|uniref:Uncharacterized protein n=1 Tax=Micromonospora yangpuensis TaxID=683228 RepID=A0A1C6V782_9ACTN|nr:hypothetical protein [Micromonospora yangpuensis]GGM18819.1 hypothetical protein GCM10012279_41440 [Micromonospora yangpuensis]SCL61750.1 hypothetical protein GA0070617_4752 [Micromonospora yangpuensis]